MIRTSFFIFLILVTASIRISRAEDGYDLWLRYKPVSDTRLLQHYNDAVNAIMVEGESPTMILAAGELRTGLSSMLGSDIQQVTRVREHGTIVAGTPSDSK